MATTTPKAAPKTASKRSDSTTMNDTTVKDAVGEASDGIQRLIGDVEHGEKSVLEAVRRFVDTVNDAFPDVTEDGPRRQIIDAAFQMTERVVEASNKMAITLVDATEGAIGNLTRSAN